MERTALALEQSTQARLAGGALDVLSTTVVASVLLHAAGPIYIVKTLEMGRATSSPPHGRFGHVQSFQSIYCIHGLHVSRMHTPSRFTSCSGTQ